MHGGAAGWTWVALRAALRAALWAACVVSVVAARPAISSGPSGKLRIFKAWIALCRFRTP